MHLRLLAVGDRQPAWVDEAFKTYTGRFPGAWKFSIDSVRVAKRSRGETAGRARAVEGEQLLAKIRADEQVVLLDERGRKLTTRELAGRLAAWQADGRDLCFVIGGPDGVDEAVVARADVSVSLSALTLPHGLARVLLAEQLYRASSLQSGHPYHRD